MIEDLTYGDLYLKFADEAEATSLLEDYPGAVDVIGIIYQSTGEDTPPVELDGWHVNTRGPMLESLLPYAVHPAHPVRVWA